MMTRKGKLEVEQQFGVNVIASTVSITVSPTGRHCKTYITGTQPGGSSLECVGVNGLKHKPFFRLPFHCKRFALNIIPL